MKSDKGVQLNRGRCVYRSTQAPKAIDAEDETIQDNAPVEEDCPNTTIPKAKKDEGVANEEITT